MSRAWMTWREDVGGVGAIALVVGASWLGLVRPSTDARTEADRLQLETDLLRSQVAMVQTQARQARADLDAVAGGLGQGVALRPKSELNRVVADLNAAAARVGITLEGNLAGAVERLPEVTRHRITLSGRGTYAGGVEFLRVIRDEFPDVTVVVLSAMTNPSDEAAPALLSFEVAWHAQAESVVSSGIK